MTVFVDRSPHVYRVSARGGCGEVAPTLLDGFGVGSTGWGTGSVPVSLPVLSDG